MIIIIGCDFSGGGGEEEQVREGGNNYQQKPKALILSNCVYFISLNKPTLASQAWTLINYVL